MRYTEEETRPATLLQEWHDKYRLPLATYDEAKSMCYLRLSEVKNGERVSRWALGSIQEYGTEALMETFRAAMKMVREDVENGVDGNDVTDVLGLLLVSHGVGRWGTEHPDTGEPCLFSDLPEQYQREIIEQATGDELTALRLANIPCRVVNIISMSGLLGEVTLFPPDEEPTVEINEQWTATQGDGISTQGAVDEILVKTMTLLTLLSEIARDGYDLTPDGMMNYARGLMKSGDESANGVMALVLRMVAHGLENSELDLSEDDDE
jgi:hypothetical protein